MKKALLTIALITILSLVASWPLLHSGFFPTHDGNWMVIRLSAFHQSLISGHFPVRWTQRLNHGYGYPVLNFLYPLTFYAAEVFYLITSSPVTAVKLLMLISFPLSALTMFYFLRQKFSFYSSLAGSLLYLYTPYRLADVYVRGSLAEAFAFIFPPLLFLGIDLIHKKSRWGIPLTAASLAAAVMAHNVFIIFLPLAFLYGLKQPRRPQSLILAFLLGIGLSATFTLPALYELQFVKASVIQIADPTQYLANLPQLISPSWSFDQVSPFLGWINLAVLVASLFLFLRRPRYSSILFSVAALLSILLLLNFSAPIWQILPAISIIHFPWRLLSLFTFSTAFLTASLLSQSTSGSYLPAGLILLAIIFNLPYIKTQGYTYQPDSFYTTNDATTNVRNEYLPLWVDPEPANLPASRIKTPRRVDLNITQDAPTRLIFTATSPTQAQLTVNTIYYPGWQVKINNQQVSIDYKNHNGLIAFDIPSGSSQIEVAFTETPLRRLANLITLISLAAVIWLIIKRQ